MWADQNTSMDLICPSRLQFVAPELPLGQQEGGGVGESRQGRRRQLEPCASGLHGGSASGCDCHCLCVGGVQNGPPKAEG